MKKYLKYTGNMWEHIINFVGKDNIITEQHSSTGVTGYFLTDNNQSDRKMFCSNMYIIKDLETGNISLDYRKPGNAFLEPCLRAGKEFWVITSKSGEYLSSILDGVPVLEPNLRKALAFETSQEVNNFIALYRDILTDDSFDPGLIVPKNFD